MAAKIDAYVQRITGMMATVENNDANVKGTTETKMMELRATTNQTITDAAAISNAQLIAHQAEMTNYLNGVNSKLQASDTQAARTETAYIHMEQFHQAQEVRTQQMEQEAKYQKTEAEDFRKFEKHMIAEVGQGSIPGNRDYKDKKEFYKTIMEYKRILDLKKLT